MLALPPLLPLGRGRVEPQVPHSDPDSTRTPSPSPKHSGPGFRPNPAAVAALDDSPELDIFDLADLAALRRRLKTDLKDHEREAALFRAAAERGLRLEASLAARADAASHGPSFATEPGLRGWLQDAAVHFWAYRCGGVCLCWVRLFSTHTDVCGGVVKQGSSHRVGHPPRRPLRPARPSPPPR